MPALLLAVPFFGIALIYASVGLGGGSAYAALLLLADTDYTTIPATALTLNLVVTTLSAVTFIRSGQLKVARVWPYFILSVPLAYFGGRLNLPRDVFLWLLLLSLMAIAGRIYFWNGTATLVQLSRRERVAVGLALGALLGFLAGAVGIGGGIFLVPLIILFGLGTAREAASAGTVFIWVNSLAGLLPRVQSGLWDPRFILPLMLAVAAGGLAGASLGAYRLQPATVQRVLGIVILAAIVSVGTKLA